MRHIQIEAVCYYIFKIKEFNNLLRMYRTFHPIRNIYDQNRILSSTIYFATYNSKYHHHHLDKDINRITH